MLLEGRCALRRGLRVRNYGVAVVAGEVVDEDAVVVVVGADVVVVGAGVVVGDDVVVARRSPALVEVLGDPVPLWESETVVRLVTGLAMTVVVDVVLDGPPVSPEAGTGAGRTRM